MTARPETRDNPRRAVGAGDERLLGGIRGGIRYLLAEAGHPGRPPLSVLPARPLGGGHEG